MLTSNDNIVNQIKKKSMIQYILCMKLSFHFSNYKKYKMFNFVSSISPKQMSFNSRIAFISKRQKNFNKIHSQKSLKKYSQTFDIYLSANCGRHGGLRSRHVHSDSGIGSINGFVLSWKLANGARIREHSAGNLCFMHVIGVRTGGQNSESTLRHRSLIGLSEGSVSFVCLVTFPHELPAFDASVFLGRRCSGGGGGHSLGTIFFITGSMHVANCFRFGSLLFFSGLKTSSLRVGHWFDSSLHFSVFRHGESSLDFSIFIPRICSRGIVQRGSKSVLSPLRAAASVELKAIFSVFRYVRI